MKQVPFRIFQYRYLVLWYSTWYCGTVPGTVVQYLYLCTGTCRTEWLSLKLVLLDILDSNLRPLSRQSSALLISLGQNTDLIVLHSWAGWVFDISWPRKEESPFLNRLIFQKWYYLQCYGSEMIYSGSGSGSSFEFSKFWIRIRIQPILIKYRYISK